MRGKIDEVRDEHEALWRALCDRVYPIRDALGVGDARRLYHQDLPLLTDMDLDLDKLRARFRVCLEADFSDRMWLLERIDKIADEQARRAELAWPPTDPEDIPMPLTREPEAAAPQPAQERSMGRPSRRSDNDGYGMGRETLRESVLRTLAEMESRYVDPTADGVVEPEDAR